MGRGRRRRSPRKVRHNCCRHAGSGFVGVLAVATASEAATGKNYRAMSCDDIQAAIEAVVG